MERRPSIIDEIEKQQQIATRIQKICLALNNLLNDFRLVDELYKLCVDLPEFPKLLFEFFQVYGKEKDLLQWAINEEVLSTKFPSELCRGNTLALKLFYLLFFDELGERYLVSLILPLINAIIECETSLEVDPDRLAKGAVVNTEENVKWFSKRSSELISRLLKSVDSCPILIRQSFLLLRKAIETKFPEQNSILIVGSAIVLRFFGPPLASPMLFGLFSHDKEREDQLQDEHVKRGLVIALKILQMIANGVKIEGNKNYTNLYNNLIELEHKRIMLYIENLTNEQVISQVSKSLSASISCPTGSQKENAEEQLRKYLLSCLAPKSMDSITEQEWLQIFSKADESLYKRSACISQPGDHHFHQLMRVCSGSVLCSLEKNGHLLASYTVENGGLLGYTGFIDDGRNNATWLITAENETVTLMSIEISQVVRFLKENPLLSAKFYREIAKMLAFQLRQLETVVQPSNGKTMEKFSSSSSSSSSSDNPNSTAPSTSVQHIIDASNFVEEKQESINSSQVISTKEPERQAAFNVRFPIIYGDTLLKEFDVWNKRNISYRGTLYYSTKHVSFYAKVFGFEIKEIIPIANILHLAVDQKLHLDISSNKKNEEQKKRFTFLSGAERDEFFNDLQERWKDTLKPMNQQSSSGSMRQQPHGQMRSSASVSTLNSKLLSRLGVTSKSLSATSNMALEELPTKQDWNHILRDAKLLTYTQNESIVSEGENSQRIFQIISGECRIEKRIPNSQSVETRLRPSSSLPSQSIAISNTLFQLQPPQQPSHTVKVLGVIKRSEIFGEMSFLQGTGASASVVAHSPRVDLMIIEGFTLRLLFDSQPSLAARFYKYLASVIGRRLFNREKQIFESN